MSLISRPGYLRQLEQAFKISPVVGLLGPRQCGKTTLARMYAGDREHTFFDLEHTSDRARLVAPLLTLGNLHGLVVIDEIRRMPGLFETLRVLVDDPKSEARFLVLGSASPRLMKGASESLAGRIAFVDLSGFNLGEVGPLNLPALWNRGGFPRAYLAAGDSDAFQWRDNFIRTFLERDIPQLGISIPAETLRRFWTMVAHYHGRVWNAAAFARSLGAAEATARNYLDILSGAYMVRQLQPWYANVKKRQVKSPKVYIRDSGVLHALLSLETSDDVTSHPVLAPSWEGFVIEEIAAITRTRDLYFWATHAGAELDLLMFKKGKAFGFEIKYTDAPRTAKSMRIAIADLGLEHLYIVYPGTQTFLLDDKISALSIYDLPSAFPEFR